MGMHLTAREMRAITTKAHEELAKSRGFDSVALGESFIMS